MNRVFLLRQKNSTRYYSDILDNTHCMYGFMNKSSALKCRQFLVSYHVKYKRYPSMGREYALKYIGSNEPILLEEEPIEDMKNKCVLNGVHLVGIHTFDYSLQFDEARFSGIILTEDIEAPQELVRDNLEFLLEY
jgi:hypothetical protein